MKRGGRATKAAPRIGVERSNAQAVSRALWQGLVNFNVGQAGPANYERTVMSARDANGRLLGGLILESYWRESYVELLWLSAKARRGGLGSRLLEEAEHFARRRGSRLLHLNTFSFQAPAFYERHGFRRFGRLSGSPEGASRYYYVKRLRPTRRRLG
jgi:GNAT superfamily N-acetyltransferase